MNSAGNHFRTVMVSMRKRESNHHTDTDVGILGRVFHSLGIRHGRHDAVGHENTGQSIHTTRDK